MTNPTTHSFSFLRDTFRLPAVCLVLSCLSLCLLASGCKPAPSGEEAKPQVTVSIEPLRFFTEQIAGNYFEVSSMVTKGNSPETYEPTPQQIIDLENSLLYIGIGGLGFEANRLGSLKAAAPDTRFVDVEKELTDNRLPAHAGGICSHHGTSDPHVWTSPRNMRIIAAAICNALSQTDSTHADDFRARLDSVLIEIDETDRYIHQRTEHLSRRSFLIYHPTLTYFAKDYGLKQIAIEEDGKAPTAKQMSALVKTSRSERPNVIFVQKEFDRSNAELVARETGTRIVEINPLSYDWHQEMRAIADALSDTTSAN